jgi:hypothetical protein
LGAVKKIERVFSAVPTPQNSRWANWLESRLKRGETEVFAEEVEIGPALGELLLELNDNNRDVRDDQVHIYARQMKEGRWRLTNEGIGISKARRLLDGQHRLHGGQQAAVTFPAIIHFGLDDDVQPVIGTGLKRTAGDTFTTKGVHGNSVTLAAATSWVMQITKGAQLRAGGVRRSNEEIYEEYLRHPDLHKSLGVAGKKKLGVSPALMTALHYLCAKKDQGLADEFFLRALTGVGLEDTDPAYVLRQRFEANLASKAKLPQWHLAALTIKAWNKARNDEPMKSLRWAAGEEFPVIE